MALSDLSILGAFNQARDLSMREQQAAQAGQMGQLQQVGALQKILANEQTRQAMAQSGGDPEKAMAILLQSGNVTGAHALAPVMEAARKAKMDKLLTGLSPEQLKDPSVLRQLGTHDPRFMAEADRLEKLASDSATLKTMKGSQVEAPVPSAPNEIEAIAKLNAQGGGTVEVAPTGTATGTVTRQQGGIFADLMKSPIPEIATQAANMQASLNRAGTSIPAQYWQSQQSALAARETALMNRPERATASSDIAKLNADLAAGRITQEQFDRATGKKLGVTTGVDPASAQLHGDPYLSTLDPTTQQVVRGLVDYTLPLNSIPARSGQDRQNFFAHAKQVDPNFNVAKYAVRQGIMTDFTKGKTADNIVAIDQAINHMGSLDKLGTALENNDIKAVNAVVNFIKDQTGNPSVNNFATAKQAVGTELMRVFRQVNASEIETKAWEERFKESNSPAQIRGALQVGVKLLDGRINAINNRWNRGMETTGGYPKILSPEAMGVLDTLTGSNGAASSTERFNDSEKERRYQEWKARQK